MPVITGARDSAGVGIERISWTGIAAGDTFTGHLIACQSGAIGCVQVSGTIGGATVALQGSNDGTNYFNLTDAAGNAISLTATGLRDFSTAAAFIRPVLTGGTGVSLSVIVVLRG